MFVGSTCSLSALAAAFTFGLWARFEDELIGRDPEPGLAGVELAALGLSQRPSTLSDSTSSEPDLSITTTSFSSDW